MIVRRPTPDSALRAERIGAHISRSDTFREVSGRSIPNLQRTSTSSDSGTSRATAMAYSVSIRGVLIAPSRLMIVRRPTPDSSARRSMLQPFSCRICATLTPKAWSFGARYGEGTPQSRVVHYGAQCPKVHYLIRSIMTRLPNHGWPAEGIPGFASLTAATDVACPRCGSAIGETCRVRSGHKAFFPHPERADISTR